jgi:FkbM family methyltransferase
MDLENKLLQYINYENGIFIECGANDGIFQSNTLKLQNEKNWHGFLIEPSINAFNKCKEKRNNGKNIILNYALVSKDFPDDYVIGDFDGHPMCSINGKRMKRECKVKVPVKTLTDILKEYQYKKIDLFVLDVEGYELQVLQGLDFEYCKPEYLLIEIYTKDMDDILYHLNGKYDMVCNLSNFNHKDHKRWDGTHNDYLFKKK